MIHRSIDRATTFVGISLAGLIVLAAARVACLDGLVRRVSIDGPSMAPSLLGRHFAMQCIDCRFLFHFDGEHVPDDGRYVCPNCGLIQDRPPENTLRPAQTVLIDRWPLLFRRPRRGEMVACLAPDGAPTVKRVAWLPTEHPQIFGGECYDGTRPITKSPSEGRQLRLLVHDDAYRPKSKNSPPRWRGDGWRMEGEQHVLAANQAVSGIRWLAYEHWPGTLDAARRTSPSPVTDNDSYNQSQTLRELNLVRDVVVTCHIRAEQAFHLRACDGSLKLEVELQPQGQAVVKIGQKVLSQKFLAPRFGCSLAIEFGLCDSQVFLVLNGQTVLCHPYASQSKSIGTIYPLAIGAAIGSLHVEHLHVWRDIYYLDADGLSRGWQSAAPLGPDEYGLLGDNQPVSVDSRQWEAVGVPRAAIWGVVYRPFWSQKTRHDRSPQSTRRFAQ